MAAGRNALAVAYFRTGDFEAVASILAQALSRATAAGDRKAEAAAIDLQGLLLHDMAIEQPPEERARIDSGPEHELFDRALAIRRQIGDIEGVAESMFHLGLVYQVLRGDAAAASPYFREALALVEAQPDSDVLLRSEIHRHIGFDRLLREQRHDEALAHLHTSLDLRSTLDEPGWTVSGLVALAMGERLAGMRPEAIDHSRRAVELARAEGLRERHIRAAEDALRAAEAMPAGGGPG
ncbi:MAG: tetratricopeptide repeat protein [Dehalococcoidia bacterium]